MIFGAPVLVWVVRLVLAVIVFYVVEWLLPKLLAALTLSPPAVLVTLIALLCALLVLSEGYWRPRFNGPRA